MRKIVQTVYMPIVQPLQECRKIRLTGVGTCRLTFGWFMNKSGICLELAGVWLICGRQKWGPT